MKHIELGYYTTKQDWKDLIDGLKEIDGLTVADFPDTDSNGLFLDYSFVTVEYCNQFYYIQRETYGSCFTVTPYLKVSPWLKRQAAYGEDVHTSEELVIFIMSCPRYGKPLTVRVNKARSETCPEKRMYLTEGFYTLCKDGDTGMKRFERAMGFRERDIYDCLVKIENIMSTPDYKVLRFHSDDNYFDWECKSGRVTG